MHKLFIKKLNENAVVPQTATALSAGYDLCACTETPVIIHPHYTVLIGTGLSIALPNGTAGLIYARSGLASKHGIIPANCVGVVDADYRGEVKVALHNLSDTPYTITAGERIAQLVITPIITPQILVVDTLDDTARGIDGFGSTGK